MDQFTITRGIATKEAPYAPAKATFTIEADRVEIAKRVADEMAFAVAHHNGVRINDKNPADWALELTDKDGQRPDKRVAWSNWYAGTVAGTVA